MDVKHGWWGFDVNLAKISTYNIILYERLPNNIHVSCAASNGEFILTHLNLYSVCYIKRNLIYKKTKIKYLLPIKKKVL